MSHEKLTIVGNIGSVERKRRKGSNEPYAKISVAVDSRMDAGETTWYQVILLHDCVAGETFLERYQVGRLLLAEGLPRVELGKAQDGQTTIVRTVITKEPPELLDRPKPKKAA